MRDHPMLMPRDPPPILDVTRPALPKVQACRPEDRAMLATPELAHAAYISAKRKHHQGNTL